MKSIKIEGLEWSASEKERYDKVMSGESVVANLSKDKCLVKWAKENGLLVKVDRSSKWGNPFLLGEDGDRDEVCDAYEVYFDLKKGLHDKVATLQGKVLGCHCHPERCHGDFLVRKAASYSET